MEEKYRLNPAQKDELLSYLEKERGRLGSLLLFFGIALACLTPIALVELISKGFFGALFGFGFPLMLIAGAFFIVLLCKGYFSHRLGPDIDRKAVLQDKCEIVPVVVSCKEENKIGAPPYFLLDRAGMRYQCMSPFTYSDAMRGDTVFAVICPSGKRYILTNAKAPLAYTGEADGQTYSAVNALIAVNQENTMVPPEEEGVQQSSEY